MKNILITGSAGFIGFYSKYLINKNFKVVGIDNINDYYDKKIKYDRLRFLKKFKNFKFFKIDISNFQKIDNLVKKFKIEAIIHFAAQAGVRFSIINPKSYISNNIDGFLNILEISKKNKLNI